MNELIKELEEDVKGYEKAVAQTEQELKDTKRWLDTQKLYLAEAIIRLHKEKYGDDNMLGTL